jgi:hypothetical protein
MSATQENDPDFRLNVRVPADATRVSVWLPTTDGRRDVRLFDGTHRDAGGVRVDILGAQRLDGSVKPRWVTAGSLDDTAAETIDYDALQARRLASEMYMVAEIEAITDPETAADGFALAAALAEAADEVDGWTEK